MSKKSLRAERAKVKLKAKKTILPKGQNITDTNFKVKKIVIREQLKAANEDDLLSTRNLNVKELLSRLRHHNTSVRQAAVVGLREVTSRAGAVAFHLAPLVTGLAETALDLEGKVRRDGIKLLDAALKKVSCDQIAPVFATLASYLGCAMTHIHGTTREDSLLLLDALLESCPTLVAAHSTAILPNFLDMVSMLQGDSTKSRSLTVNLDSKMTSIKWRNKVLSRLHQLLAAMAHVHSHAAHTDSTGKVAAAPEIRWDGSKPLMAGLCNPILIQRCDLFAKKGPGANSNEATEMTTHLESLMPLLFQTWIEDAPNKNGATVLTPESADLLGSVLQVIQLSWDLLAIFEQQSQGATLTKWFKQKYESDIKKYLMSGFPYSCEFENLIDEGSAEKREGTKRKRQTFSSTKIKSIGPSVTRPCLLQNLALCHLLCCVHDSGDKELCIRVVAYLTGLVGRWRKMDTDSLMQLVKVVRLVLIHRSQQWMARGIPLVELLSVVLQHFHSLDGEARASVWELIGDLTLDSRCKHLMQCPELVDWQQRLPLALTMPQVSLKTVRVIGKLVIQRNDSFLEALEQQLPLILDNLMKIEVIGASSVGAGREIVGNVLFWVAGSPKFRATVDSAIVNWDDQTKGEIQRINDNWVAANC